MVHDPAVITHRNILHHPSLHLVVLNLLHVPHVKCANLQGAILAAANYQQIFVSPLAERLVEAIKAF